MNFKPRWHGYPPAHPVQVFERIPLSAVPGCWRSSPGDLDIKFDYMTKINGTLRARAVVRAVVEFSVQFVLLIHYTEEPSQ